MNHTDLQHFILTRFNLLLWNKDKERKPVRTVKWLEHRFELFVNYCLPSVKNQTCKKFEWIVLFDSTTPERFKERIEEWQKECPQLKPIYVVPKDGHLFAQVFREEVVRRLKNSSTSEAVNTSATTLTCSASVQEFNGRVLTTYLDNDDALNVRFVEDLQKRVQALADGTFIYYTNGYQYFTDHQYLMKKHYTRNNFVSVIESSIPATVKTIYGFGSHYYIDKIEGARIEYVKNLPMWSQVVHERNMGNDAYSIRVKMEKDSETLRRDFAIDKPVRYGADIFLFRYLPRYVKSFVRRVKIKLRGYRFE